MCYQGCWQPEVSDTSARATSASVKQTVLRVFFAAQEMLKQSCTLAQALSVSYSSCVPPLLGAQPSGQSGLELLTRRALSQQAFLF